MTGRPPGVRSPLRVLVVVLAAAMVSPVLALSPVAAPPAFASSKAVPADPHLVRDHARPRQSAPPGADVHDHGRVLGVTDAVVGSAAAAVRMAPPDDPPVGEPGLDYLTPLNTGKPDVGFRFPHNGFLGTYQVNGQGTFCIDLNGQGPSTASGYASGPGTRIRTQVGWTTDHKGGNASSLKGPWLTDAQLGKLAYITERYAETSSATTAAAAEHVVRLITVGDKAQAAREVVRWNEAVKAHPLLAKVYPVVSDEVAKRAGPYRLSLGWTTPPTAYTSGVLAVQVLSNAGVALPGVAVKATVRSPAGTSSLSGTTGGSGTARLTVPVQAAGALGVTVTTGQVAAEHPLLYLPKKYETPGTTDYAAQRTVGRAPRSTLSGTLSTTIAAAVPTVTVAASETKVYPGSTVSGTVTIKGTVPKAGGTAVATLWGPFAAKPTSTSCAAPSPSAGDVGVDVTGDGTFTIPGITATDPGYYVWTVTLPGNALQSLVTTACGAATATAQVLDPVTPKVTTKSSATSILPGGTVTDTLTVSGTAPNYTGTATATLWGPFAAKPTSTSCTGAAQAGQGSVAITGNGTFTTPSVTLTTPGYYTWTDTLTATVAQKEYTTICGADVVQVLPKVSPKITQKAVPATLAPNGTVTDAITVKGSAKGYTGTATATLWGPYSAKPTAGDCAATDPQVGQGSVAVTGDGTFTTPSLTIPTAGYYTWTVTLPGSIAQADVTTVCGETAAGVLVTATPTITIGAAGPLLAGDDGVGTITATGMFPDLALKATATLYGPFGSAPTASSCTSGKKLMTSTVQLNGDGTYTTDSVTVSMVGYYSWTLSVPKDTTEPGVTQACGAAVGLFQVVRTDLGALTVTNTSTAGSTAPSGTTVGKGQPYLSIPSVSINAPLVPVGLLPPGIDTPDDPSLAGEVDVAAHAGEAAGTIVVAGRVGDVHNNPGAFFRLSQVAVGAQITLKDPLTGVTQKFVVNSVQILPRVQVLPASLFTQSDTPLRLVILSATDEIWYGGGTMVTHRSHVVVTATAG
jgi:hypothetical protein